MLFEIKFSRFVNLVCLTTIVVFLSACEGKPIAKEKLFGRYELVDSRFAGSLQLKSDYTFVQEFVVAANETKIARGTWYYIPPRNGDVNQGTIIICGAIREDESKLIQMKFDFGISLPVFTNWKGVWLWLDSDGDRAYLKKAN